MVASRSGDLDLNVSRLHIISLAFNGRLKVGEHISGGLIFNHIAADRSVILIRAVNRNGPVCAVLRIVDRAVLRSVADVCPSSEKSYSGEFILLAQVNAEVNAVSVLQAEVVYQKRAVVVFVMFCSRKIDDPVKERRGITCKLACRSALTSVDNLGSIRALIP